MININVILPHIKKFGGVRRYLEFGNALLRTSKEVNYNIWLIDYDDYDWVKELDFKGNIFNLKSIDQYDFSRFNKNIVICGDAGSLKYIDQFKDCDLRIVNIIFPLNTGYALGDYSKYLTNKDPKTLIIGNSTGWDKDIPSQSNYFTIPGGINLDMFYPVDKESNNVFKVLFMGKNRPWKGYDKFIELIKKVKQDNNVALEFGYFDTEAHPELDSLGVNAFINVPQQDMKQIYCNHNCFLSFEELAGWQNTVAEAMACKVPVITTPFGTTDLANHNKTSLVLQNQEKIVDEALTYIFILRHNKQLCEALSNAAYENVKAFSWDNYALAYLNLFYEKLNFKQIPESRANIPEEEISEESLSIKEKAKELNKYITTFYNPKKSLAFDKYEKFGAYHWNSEHDKPYHTYISFLKKSFEALAQFYGDEYSMIDIGGGDGFISYNLKDYVKSIDIIELNKKAVELATEKLKDETKITVKHQDIFDTDLSQYDIVLLSQVIEHFEQPESLIAYFKKFNPKIIIMSTPLAKKDGTMWDQNYHHQEFFPEDLIELVKPLADDYIVSLSVIKPHNQLMVLENRQNTINNYVESIFFNPDFKPDTELQPQIVDSLVSMGSNKPKINYIEPKIEEEK